MIETKIVICQNCKSTFEIVQEDLQFYSRIKVPSPTRCPDCRKQRRLAWRNDFYLYSRSCDLCMRSIVSIYPPGVKRVIYCSKCWWSDNWSADDYAEEIDFSRSFFEQFNELQERIPTLTLVNDNDIASVNCEYTQDFAFGKNCYLVFISWKIEDCMYSLYLWNAKEIVDSVWVFGNSSYLYDSMSVGASYRSSNIYYSSNMRDSMFCYDCRDCSNCFLSIGIRHKQYYFKNQPYAKEEYEKIIAAYRIDTYTGREKAKKEFADILLRYPHKFAHVIQSINSTGDNLDECKNVKYGYNVSRGEDSKFIQDCSNFSKDGYDISVGGEWNECYESITPDQSYRDLFTMYSWKNIEVTYSDNCHSSKYLFGCVGVKKGEHKILNKRYSKEEYETLHKKLISHMQKTGEWGEFFPTRMSPFGYNISSANLYFPLEKQTALTQGFKWEEQIQLTKGLETLHEVPDSIYDVSEHIIKETLACKTCQRNYKILPQEFSFYKSMGIPIPRECFYCRNLARFKFRNPQKLWHRACTCVGQKSANGTYRNQSSHFHGTALCSKEFETTYSPERPEIVYCENCYQEEIQ